MKKVLIGADITPEQKKKFEAISSDYQIAYGKKEYDANILVGNFSPLECSKFENLELILTTMVGYDSYIKKGALKDNVILCNAVDVHSEEVGEHVFVNLLSMIKNLHLYRDNQAEAKWHDEGKIKSIVDLKVAVLGLGNIGKYIAKLCKSLGMYVIGVKRDISSPLEYVDELKTLDDLDSILPNVDAVLSVLPSNEKTRHIFTLERFKLMKKDALLINAGRGDLIDTEVLKEVLDKKIIAGIGQDVYEKEPIDSDSVLWSYKNLVITPHVAGFFHLEKAREKFVDLCVENLKRYINNEELLNIVYEREK